MNNPLLRTHKERANCAKPLKGEMNMRRLFRCNFIIGVFMLCNLSTAHELEPSLILECNELASVFSVTQSSSSFGELGRKHEGWSLGAESAKHRTRTIPYYFEHKKPIEESCLISNVKISIKIHRYARDFKANRCDETLRISVTANGNKLFDEIPLGFAECDDEFAFIEKINISPPNEMPKSFRPRIRLSGELNMFKEPKNVRKGELVFSVITDEQNNNAHILSKRGNRSHRLPLDNSTFTNFFYSKE